MVEIKKIIQERVETDMYEVVDIETTKDIDGNEVQIPKVLYTLTEADVDRDIAQLETQLAEKQAIKDKIIALQKIL